MKSILGFLMRSFRSTPHAFNRTVTLPNWLNALAASKNFNFSLVLQEALKEKLHLI